MSVSFLDYLDFITHNKGYFIEAVDGLGILKVNNGEEKADDDDSDSDSDEEEKVKKEK